MNLLLTGLFLSLACAAQPGLFPLPIAINGAAAPPSSLSFASTNTQITLSYDAPDSGVCTVEASESLSYSPPAHDVDTALFANANRDDRDGAITRGTHRVFVLGQRLTARALDSALYSRALQAHTLHYVRVTCGATVMTGSTSTLNIPLNSTYQDIPQLDRSNPGNTLLPTLPALRDTPVIDPHTGAKILQVSLASDRPYDSGNPATYGPFLYDSGGPRVCTASLVGPGPGYLCKFQQGDGGPEAMYYIIPSTGERRYLGSTWVAGALNAIDGKFYFMNGADLAVQSYNGTYATNSLSFSAPTTILANLLTAIHTFDSGFDSSLFAGCGLGPVGDFIHLNCPRNGQDSYAWVGAVRISTNTVVAATRPDSNIRTRGCATHQIVATGYDEPLIQIIPHSFVDGVLGKGPYLTTLTADMTSGATTIHVAGEPACGGCGADPGVALAQVGDVFQIGGELVQISTKTSSTIWVVTRGARSSTPSSHTSGDSVGWACDFTLIHWKFLADPHGRDTANASYVQDSAWSAVAGHNDATTGQLLSESGDGWVIRLGDLMTQVGQPYTLLIPSQFAFAGKNANCFGNACRKHPSVGAVGSNWFSDFPVWDFVGSGGGSNVWANVTGSLYKATGNLPAINPKHYAIAAAIGQESSSPTVKQILDVSPVAIGGTGGDNYKMCIANAVNECHAGSSAGDIYVNIPNVPGAIHLPLTAQSSEVHAATAVSGSTTLNLSKVDYHWWGAVYTFTSYTGPYPTPSMTFVITGFTNSGNNVTDTPIGMEPSLGCENASDLCVANFSRYANGVAQIGTNGTDGRILASLPLRNTNDYPTAKTLADGSYLLYAIGSASLAENWDAPSNVLMVKVPPFTAPDGVDRTTFVRGTVNITTPGGLGIATATVQFGYLEQGTMAQHYCTSRAETCVAVGSTVTDATPFSFETTDTYARKACASSCTIVVPVLPSHTAYYRVAFYDAGGAFVQYGNSGVLVEGRETH